MGHRVRKVPGQQADGLPRSTWHRGVRQRALWSPLMCYLTPAAAGPGEARGGGAAAAAAAAKVTAEAAAQLRECGTGHDEAPRGRASSTDIHLQPPCPGTTFQDASGRRRSWSSQAAGR